MPYTSSHTLTTDWMQIATETESETLADLAADTPLDNAHRFRDRLLQRLYETEIDDSASPAAHRQPLTEMCRQLEWASNEMVMEVDAIVTPVFQEMIGLMQLREITMTENLAVHLYESLATLYLDTLLRVYHATD